MDIQNVIEPLQIEEIKVKLLAIKEAKLTRLEIEQLMQYLEVHSKEAVAYYTHGKVKNRLLNTCFIIKANEIIANRKK